MLHGTIRQAHRLMGCSRRHQQNRRANIELLGKGARMARVIPAVGFNNRELNEATYEDPSELDIEMRLVAQTSCER